MEIAKGSIFIECFSKLCHDLRPRSWKTQTWPRICKLAQNWATLKKYFFYCLFYCLFYCTNIVEIHVGHRTSPCRLCWKTGFSVLLLYKYMLDTISTAICTIVLTIHVEHHIIACLEPQILARHAYWTVQPYTLIKVRAVLM